MICHCFLLAVVAVVYVSGASTPWSCQTQKKVKIDAATYLAPYGDSWKIIMSSDPTDKCISFEYLINREGKPGMDTAVYKKDYLADGEAPRHSVRRSMPSEDMKSWDCSIFDAVDSSGNETYYSSYFNKDLKSFCLFTCDGDDLKSIRFFAIDGDMAGYNKEKQTKKKIYSQLTLQPGYNDCGMTNAGTD